MLKWSSYSRQKREHAISLRSLLFDFLVLGAYPREHQNAISECGDLAGLLPGTVNALLTPDYSINPTDSYENHSPSC